MGQILNANVTDVNQRCLSADNSFHKQAFISVITEQLQVLGVDPGTLLSLILKSMLCVCSSIPSLLDLSALPYSHQRGPVCPVPLWGYANAVGLRKNSCTSVLLLFRDTEALRKHLLTHRIILTNS